MLANRHRLREVVQPKRMEGERQLKLVGVRPFVSEAASLPSEVMATFKFVPRDRYWLTTSIGNTVTRGPGASAFRALVGITIAPGSKPVDAEIVQPPPRARSMWWTLVPTRFAGRL